MQGVMRDHGVFQRPTPGAREAYRKKKRYNRRERKRANRRRREKALKLLALQKAKEPTPEPSKPSDTIDLKVASKEILTNLPGLGPKLSKKIQAAKSLVEDVPKKRDSY